MYNAKYRAQNIAGKFYPKMIRQVINMYDIKRFLDHFLNCTLVL